ncbi:Gfo/Idh/MocA family oxidoreductase [Pseudogracilibacillus sp. SE30717A]|uniref:Gfo/Idh/MocA family protein n=1 Tax=Pseudogracilibacillus sp. SE30717A TaxID=3098293 RepID=UPI00300E5A00
MLKIAVIGLGDVSKVHLSTIRSNPDVTLVAVCDLDESLNKLVSGVKFYTNYKEMLENERLDCVHICLPHHLHYEVTKACAEKGIHIYLEKPLAHTMEEGLSIVRLEERLPDVKICVSLQNRLNDTFRVLENEVTSGRYGKIIGIKGIVTWFRPKSYYYTKAWRGQKEYAGGGVLINQAIHTLDLIQLLGGEIESIRGKLSNLHDYNLNVEDTAVVNMYFTSGAKGLIVATTANAIDSSIELEVVCEQAQFTIRNEALYKYTADEGEVKLIEDEQFQGEKFYYGAGHHKLINQFYQCILKEKSSYIHAKDAFISLRIIDAIEKSSIEDKEIILAEKISN